MSNLDLFNFVHLLPVTLVDLGWGRLNADISVGIRMRVCIEKYSANLLSLILLCEARCQGNKVNSRTSCAVKRMYGKGGVFVQTACTKIRAREKSEKRGGRAWGRGYCV